MRVGRAGRQSNQKARWAGLGWPNTRQTGRSLAHLPHAVPSEVGLNLGGGLVQRTAFVGKHALQQGMQLGAHACWQAAAATAALHCRCCCRILLLRRRRRRLQKPAAAAAATTAAVASIPCSPGRPLSSRFRRRCLGLLGWRAQGERIPAPGLQLELVELVEELGVQALALLRVGGRKGGGGGGHAACERGMEGGPPPHPATYSLTLPS